jgi:coenzyme F420 hydrogenase subunit beta
LKIKKSGWDLIKERVLDVDLCCGCGACEGTCPVDAISIDSKTSHLPEISIDDCIHCTLCYEVCPGDGYSILNNKTDKKNFQSILGSELDHALGFSTNFDQRLNGASGGLTTALVQYCINSGIADEALVVLFENDTPQVVLTNNLDVIASARGSVYTPVPLMTVIHELRTNPRKIVIVGTGCHIAAWDMAAKKHHQLRDLAVLKIGFVCGGVQKVEAIKAIGSGLGVDYPQKVEFIGMREGGFPGAARFKDRVHDTTYDMPLYDALDMAIPYYTLNRCALCPDNSALLADIVVADHHKSKDDNTAVTIRTKQGLILLEESRKAGYTNFDYMSDKTVKEATIRQILSSRVFPALTKLEMLKKGKISIPIFDIDIDSAFKEYPQYYKLKLIWKIKYYLVRLSSNRRIVNFLIKKPKIMRRLGNFLYYIPSSIPFYMTMARLRRKIINYLS